MASSLLFNRVKVATATTGTGTITLGAAQTSFLTFANGGVANGNQVSYLIEDGTAWEIGTGTYTSSGTTLSRTVIKSSNSNTAITLSGTATVSLTALSTDIVTLDATQTLTNKTLTSPTVNTATISGGTVDNASVGATTTSTGAFTTLAASSTVSGTGFSTYLASPPAIGGTAAAAGSFTTVAASTSSSSLSFRNSSVNAIGSVTTALAINVASGDIVTATLGGNPTVSFTNVPASGIAVALTLIVTQDATGSRTISWPTAVVCDGGTRATNLKPLATASSVTIYSLFTSNGGTTWYTSRLNASAYANT